MYFQWSCLLRMMVPGKEITSKVKLGRFNILRAAYLCMSQTISWLQNVFQEMLKTQTGSAQAIFRYSSKNGLTEPGFPTTNTEDSFLQVDQFSYLRKNEGIISTRCKRDSRITYPWLSPLKNWNQDQQANFEPTSYSTISMPSRWLRREAALETLFRSPLMVTRDPDSKRDTLKSCWSCLCKQMKRMRALRFLSTYSLIYVESPEVDQAGSMVQNYGQILLMSSQQKAKHPTLAYARLGKTASRSRLPHKEDEIECENQSDSSLHHEHQGDNIIYNSLINQISNDHSRYMKHLAMECSNKKKQNHQMSKNIKTAGSSPQRSLSPEDSRVMTNATYLVPDRFQKSMTPKTSTTSLKHTQRFFSRHFQQAHLEGSHVKASIQRHSGVPDDKFLSFLDSYVDQLSRQSPKSQSSELNQKYAEKLAIYQYKLKEMEYVHEDQVKKMHKKQTAMKNKLALMDEQVLDLSIRLEHEQQERRRFQSMFLDYQKEIRLIKQQKVAYNNSFSPKSKDLDRSGECDPFQELADFEGSFKLSSKANRFQKVFFQDNDQLNTSQKISRFLRKPYREIRQNTSGLLGDDGSDQN